MRIADKIAEMIFYYSLGGFFIFLAWKSPDWDYRPSAVPIQLFGRKLIRLFHFLLGLTLLILSTLMLSF